MKEFFGGNASVLAVLFLLSAAGQAGAAGPDEASLQYYPDIDRVRADVEASYRDARPEEIDGRVAGRYLLFAEVLESSWGGKFGPDSFANRAPASARQLHERYMQAHADVWREKRPVSAPECVGRTLEQQAEMGICAMFNFLTAENTQTDEFAEVEQVARHYFPAEYRQDFVAHSPAQARADSTDRAARERETREQAAEAARKIARQDAWRLRVVAGALLAMLLVPTTLLALLIRRARQNRGRPSTTLTRIMSADDLHLFEITGRVLDVQRHTRTHVTTTTQHKYVHPDSWESRAPTTTTTVSSSEHLTLFVRTDDGREVQEGFVDVALAVRPENRVGIVYGGDKGSRMGVAVALVNLDTRDIAVDALQSKRIASRFPLLRAVFWGFAAAIAGTAVDLAAGLFLFTLPAMAAGVLVAITLAFAWQHSLWADIRGRVRSHAERLAAAG